jgi:hypothetical protein
MIHSLQASLVTVAMIHSLQAGREGHCLVEVAILTRCVALVRWAERTQRQVVAAVPQRRSGRGALKEGELWELVVLGSSKRTG